jgi:hypothetical protein
MFKLPGSWRTTVLGVVLIVEALTGQVKNVVDDDPNTKFNMQAVVTAVLAGWGLLHARDNKVTSEEVGAKPS